MTIIDTKKQQNESFHPRIFWERWDREKECAVVQNNSSGSKEVVKGSLNIVIIFFECLNSLATAEAHRSELFNRFHIILVCRTGGISSEFFYWRRKMRWRWHGFLVFLLSPKGKTNLLRRSTQYENSIAKIYK